MRGTCKPEQGAVLVRGGTVMAVQIGLAKRDLRGNVAASGPLHGGEEWARRHGGACLLQVERGQVPGPGMREGSRRTGLPMRLLAGNACAAVRIRPMLWQSPILNLFIYALKNQENCKIKITRT